MKRSGWLAGDIVASERDPQRGNWLTVWGSAWTAPELYPDRDSAVRSAQRGESVAHVTEVYHGGVTGSGTAYRVTVGTLADRAALRGACGL